MDVLRRELAHAHVGAVFVFVRLREPAKLSIPGEALKGVLPEREVVGDETLGVELLEHFGKKGGVTEAVGRGEDDIDVPARVFPAPVAAHHLGVHVRAVELGGAAHALPNLLHLLARDAREKVVAVAQTDALLRREVWLLLERLERPHTLPKIPGRRLEPDAVDGGEQVDRLHERLRAHFLHLSDTARAYELEHHAADTAVSRGQVCVAVVVDAPPQSVAGLEEVVHAVKVLHGLHLELCDGERFDDGLERLFAELIVAVHPHLVEVEQIAELVREVAVEVGPQRRGGLLARKLFRAVILFHPRRRSRRRHRVRALRRSTALARRRRGLLLLLQLLLLRRGGACWRRRHGDRRGRKLLPRLEQRSPRRRVIFVQDARVVRARRLGRIGQWPTVG
mmetsp:Transcript_25195/g.82679  ORF Transcript_25195/g.82679 Transcript_25195/m.82679 type:complete len:394 (-) Transcript_25195:983-2164(-)